MNFPSLNQKYENGGGEHAATKLMMGQEHRNNCTDCPALQLHGSIPPVTIHTLAPCCHGEPETPSWHYILRTGYPSCHMTNIIKAPKAKFKQ